MTRIMIYLFILIILLACGGSQSAQPSNQDSQPAQENQPASQQQAAPQAYGIGQDVTVGDVRWKILEAKDLGPELKSDNQFIEPKKTSGKFVLVRLEVENRKAEAATYAGVNLVDDKGREFEGYNEQFGFIPDGESCVLEQLNPNISKVCAEIFELPGDAAGLKVAVGDLELFGGEEAVVQLGF